MQNDLINLNSESSNDIIMMLKNNSNKKTQLNILFQVYNSLKESEVNDKVIL